MTAMTRKVHAGPNRCSAKARARYAHDLYIAQAMQNAKLSMLATSEADSDLYWKLACNALADASYWKSRG